MSILPLDDRCPRIYFYPESYEASVFFTFTGTYISISSTILGTRQAQRPARTSYSIDGGLPTVHMNLVIPHIIPQQRLLPTSLLSPSLHTLNITNLAGAGGPTYIANFIRLSISNILAERSHVEDRALVVTTLTASVTFILSYSPTTTTVIQSVTVLQSAVETSSIPQGKSAAILASAIGGAVGGIAFLVLIICFVVFLKKRRMGDQDRTIPRPFVLEPPRIRRQAPTMSVMRLYNNPQRNRPPPKEKQATLPKCRHKGYS